MKQYSRGFLSFLFLFLIFSSSASARLLSLREGELKMSFETEIPRVGSSADVKDEIFALMGSEECEERDGECLKRRMAAEAHLDYIYTQHHKP